MTNNEIKSKAGDIKANRKKGKKKKPVKSFFLKCCFGYMSIFMLLLFFKCPDATSEWVVRGLEICSRRLIPSLFPFMIVSSLLMSSGVGERIGNLFSKPFGALFGISGQGGAALFLGWLCGFPIGARSASALYRDGKISRAEFERIVCVSGTPSPAFLINTVGGLLFKDTRFGIALYAICLASCITVGIIMGREKKLYDKSEERGESKKGNTGGDSFAVMFTRAVSDSAVGMLCICGFVVFFSAFVGTLESFADASFKGSALTDIIFGFFEITIGVTRLASSSIPKSAVFVICAAVSAWSGFSVHLQVISLCGDTVFPVSKYFLANAVKAALGALLALGVLILLSLI